MSTQKFAKGDKIKWTLSGEVTGIVPFDDRVELRVTDDSGNTYYVVPNSGSVEKVEPEYEVFGPGDVIRNRRLPSDVITIGQDTHFEVGEQYATPCNNSECTFTSERYERVEIR